MSKNSLGREVGEYFAGYGPVTPFAGAWAAVPGRCRCSPGVKTVRPGTGKLLGSIEEVLRVIPVTSGMTLSFHHHLRNGDGVVNLVLAAAAKLGLKDLTIALSSVFPVHKPLVDHFRSGVVTALDTNYLSGPVAQAVAAGQLAKPVIIRTHGGRARAIEDGQLKIDVAFIAAPAADDYGNLTGVYGPAACGSLGYAMPDAEYAAYVVAVTDYLVEYPLAPVSIPGTRVDYVVPVASIGDPRGIVSGTTQLTNDPIALKIAGAAAEVIAAAGLLKNGFSFQTGAGGASLAAARYVGRLLAARGVTGSFALGGINGYLVAMLNQGLFKRLLDVQGFDRETVASLRDNISHQEISAAYYANPFTCGCAVNKLDAVVLGATEIDVDFNVNVITGSDGTIIGGTGGHADAAAGAGLTIIAANLLRSRLPLVVDRVMTVATPGETVDVLVTERGIAVNPRRAELRQRLRKAGLPVKSIRELKAAAEAIAGVPRPVVADGRVTAIVEYRDGTVIDLVRQLTGK